MKRIFTFALCAVAAAALLTGCEWSSSSEHNESWNDSYNWVNFSGTYRSAAGGILVTDYTSTPLVPGTTNNYNTTESGGTLPGGVTTGSGTTQKKPITPGSPDPSEFRRRPAAFRRRTAPARPQQERAGSHAVGEAL